MWARSTQIKQRDAMREMHSSFDSSSSSMTSNVGETDSTATLYATCARLPLIKAPSLRVPPSVTLPATLHPLPNNIHDYFVYPFSLEKFVLDAAEKRERERREEMQRRAPGWIEGGAVLEPTKRAGEEIDSKTISSEMDEIGAMLDQLGRK